MEKARSLRESLPRDKQQEVQDFDPGNMLNAINCFKDVAATAQFG